MEGLGEIFTGILLYWLISAIKLAQTSPADHNDDLKSVFTHLLVTTTTALCQIYRRTLRELHKQTIQLRLAQQLPYCVSSRLPRLHISSAYNRQAQNPSHRLSDQFLFFCVEMCASVFDPDIPRTQLLRKLPSDFLVLPGLSLSSRWVVCTTTSSPFE